MDSIAILRSINGVLNTYATTAAPAIFCHKKLVWTGDEYAAPLRGSIIQRVIDTVFQPEALRTAEVLTANQGGTAIGRHIIPVAGTIDTQIFPKQGDIPTPVGFAGEAVIAKFIATGETSL